MVRAAAAMLRFNSSRLAFASAPGCTGFLIGIESGLMIIFQIEVVGVAAFKAEGHPPVSSDGHGPNALSVASEGMETKRWLVHIPYVARLIQRRQDQSQAIGQVRFHFAAVILLEQVSQP